MKNKFLLILSVLMVISMVLAACAPAATPTPAEEPAVEEPAVEEPAAEEPTEAPAAEEPAEEPAAEEPTEAPVAEEPAPEVEQVLVGAFGVGPGGGEQETGRPWTGGAGHTHHVKLYATPFIFNEDITDIVPYMVESWESNDDFTVWTYKLRDDLKWSDGETLTANDWKFTADFITDPSYITDQLAHRALAFEGTAGYEARINGEADELEGVQVLDDQTVQYTLDTPNPRHYTTQYRTYILPEHAIDFTPAEFMETDWWVNQEKQVGSGPFKVGEYEKDAFLIVEKNPNYFLGEPKLDRIIERFFGGDITAAVLALSAGEIDFTYLEPTDIEVLGDGYNIFFNNSNVPVYTDIHYSNGEVPEFFEDIRVRQAIMHAIDRTAIVEQVLDDTHYALPCPVAFPDLWPDDVNWYDYDPEKAKALLAEAGVNPADIEMEWVGHSGYDNIHHNSALQAVQAFLADIGVSMDYRFVDVPTFRERYTADGEWTYMYRGAGLPIYGANYGRAWANDGSQGGDFKGYDMAAVGLEDAVDAINSAPTTEAYLQAIRDFCGLHNETLPDLVMWIGNRYGAAGDNVQNFWWQPAGGGGPYMDNSHLWEIAE